MNKKKKKKTMDINIPADHKVKLEKLIDILRKSVECGSNSDAYHY